MFSKKIITNVFSVCVTFVILIFSVFITKATSQAKNAGELSPTGQIRLNGNIVTLNTTIVSGGVVNTGENSEAAIHLNRLGKIKIHRSTNLTVTFAPNTISIMLESGKVTLTTFKGVVAQVRTHNGSANADINQPNKFTVATENSFSRVEALFGTVILYSGKKGKQVVQGKEPIPDIENNQDSGDLIQNGTKNEMPKSHSLVWLIGLFIEAGMAVETTLEVGATGKNSDINTACNTVNIGPNK